MKKFGTLEVEEMIMTVKSPGFKVIDTILDEIVKGIQDDLSTRPLPPNIAEATSYMYGLRSKADGAKDLVEKMRLRVRTLIAEKEKLDNSKEA